jgi:hypothetical protein
MDQKTPEEKGDDLLRQYQQEADAQEEADWLAFLQGRGRGQITIPLSQLAPDVNDGNLVYWNEQTQRYERSQTAYIPKPGDFFVDHPIGSVTFIMISKDGTRHSAEWDHENGCWYVGDPLPPEGEE